MTDPVSPQRLSDLAWLRRIRDRIDREFAQPLNGEALARGVHVSAGHLSRQFKLAYGESPYSYLMTRRVARAMAGIPPCVAKQVTRPIRNREATSASRPQGDGLGRHPVC